MATSRGATPADPTLAATTDDNSRGGLFSRSNIANPVSGADINGVSINDSTITITLNYADSTSETRTFTLNQSTDGVLTFDIPGTTSGGGGTPSADVYVQTGALSMDLNSIIFTRTDGSTFPVDISRLDGFTEQQIRTFADEQIAAASLVRTVNMVPPDTAGNVAISLSGDTFDDTSTVIFSRDPGNQNVSAVSRMLLGNGTAESTTTNAAVSLIVDPATDFQVAEVSNGVYRFQRIAPPAQPARAPAVPMIPPANTFMSSPRVFETLTAEGGTFTGVTATVDNPDGTPGPTPTVNVPTGGMTATIEIPAGMTNSPGNYQIMATTMTLGEDGMTRTDTPTIDIPRFIPYFQSRMDFTTALTPSSNLSGITISGEALPTPFESGGPAAITSIAGSGTIYIAGLDTALPDTIIYCTVGGMFSPRMVFLRNISVTLADGSTHTFNVFQTQAEGGVVINNIRTTRR